MKLDNYIDTLKDKWNEIPGGDINRIKSVEVLKMSDSQIYNFWKTAKQQATTGEYFKVRGWYHELYANSFIGKNLMDLGSGFGIDGIVFAQNGVNVTFVDIVESNLKVIKRICSYLKITNVDFVYIKNLESFSTIGKQYDVIWAQGSMLHTPFDVIKEEVVEVLKYLKLNGRWIELAYPEERWIKEGKMSFETWGEKTDGGAPWVEWYNLNKLLDRLEPAKFDLVLNFNFHNDDFNWFDLKRIA